MLPSAIKTLHAEIRELMFIFLFLYLLTQVTLYILQNKCNGLVQVGSWPQTL